MSQIRYATMVGGPADGQKHPIEDGAYRVQRFRIPVFRGLSSTTFYPGESYPPNVAPPEAFMDVAEYTIMPYQNRYGETLLVGMFEGTTSYTNAEVRYWEKRAREAEGRLLEVRGQATQVADQVAKQVAKIGQGK